MLAPKVIEGCEHAGVSIVTDRRVETFATSHPLPAEVDRLQYECDEGPCLQAIRSHGVFSTGDLAQESRWPRFSARAATETAARSMLSLRLFTEQDTLGALNLYSTGVDAFDDNSRASGQVFAAHAAIALAGARERDRAEQLRHDLTESQDHVHSYEQQAEVALALQRSMLTPLPQIAGIELAARYAPAATGVRVGGDWYDAFVLPDGRLALVVGDVAGHDIRAASQMGQMRSLLRALTVDREEPPGDLLRRLDRTASHLQVTTIATCVHALLELRPGAEPARLRYAVAGHPPPLLMAADGTTRYLPPGELHLLLGSGHDPHRPTMLADLPEGSTLLLYTDGLIERRDRGLDDGLRELRERAAALVALPLEQLCDALIQQLAAQHDDDICLLALRIPATTPNRPCTRSERSQARSDG